MKKIKNLCESDFLKVFFAFYTACFLIAAPLMPDRSEMFTGLWAIISTPGKASTSCFAIGGYAATFLTMGLVGVICLALFVGLKATANNPIAVMDYSETSGKKTLILFNGVKGDTEATCNYVGIPESSTTEITLSERLHVPLYYIVASLVCEILKDTQKSQYMMQTARSLMTSAEGAMQQTIQANT